MTKPADERRRAARFRIELKVQASGPAGKRDVLLSDDWSEHGVFLRTRSPLPPGTQLSLTVVLPKPVGPCTFSGVVARVEPTLTRARQGMIVTFDKIPEPLARFMQETQRGASAFKRALR